MHFQHKDDSSVAISDVDKRVLVTKIQLAKQIRLDQMFVRAVYHISGILQLLQMLNNKMKEFTRE
jgi:hypothetical protein